MKPRIYVTLQQATPLLLAAIVVFVTPARLQGAEVHTGEIAYAGERDTYSFRLDALVIPRSSPTCQVTANAGFGDLPVASQPLP